MSAHPKVALCAGAAKFDISPACGIQIAGDIGRYRPCASIKDPIYARALVLEQDGQKFCVLSIDLLSIDVPWAAEIRRRIHKKYGFAHEAIMLHATQNHASPEIGNDFLSDSCPYIPAEYPWLRGGDSRYNEPAVAGILAAVGAALTQLTPVSVAAGRAIDGRVAFNRRYILRDGTTLCQPGVCNPRVLRVEGPTDPEVGVATFTAADGRVVAALLHHTAHPCNGFWGNEVLPDWPGAWCREMETHFGPSCTPLVINGCCGNIITFNYLDPEQNPKGSDYLEIGRLLAQSTKRALEKMTPIDASTFAWANHVLSIPRRQIPADVVAQSKRVLEANPKPIWTDDIHVSWDWLYSVGILDLYGELTSDPNCPYELQAMRLGDFALLAVGGEPFAESQLQIKGGSPFLFTQVAHMSNGFIGYVPTKLAIAGGGYETMTGFGSKLAPEAAEMIEKASIELLQKLAR